MNEQSREAAVFKDLEMGSSDGENSILSVEQVN